jgi:pilus assembly protein CpaF
MPPAMAAANGNLSVDRKWAMGFLSNKNAGENDRVVRDTGSEAPSARQDDFYADLITRRPGLLDEKLKLHERIIDEFNLTALEKMPSDELAKQVRTYVADHVRRESLSLNQKELDIFSNEIIAEMTGYGPIEPLLKDPTVTDILINTHKRCYIERFGQLQETKVHFKDEAHLLRIINRIVSAIGRRVDESSPMVDARLRDGSRVNVAVRPIAVDGPLVSIRKFAERALDMGRLIEVGTLRPAMAEVLAAAVAGKVSTIIAGGTGSGKTTMLNALSNFIPNRERLITIEDAAELQLQQPHVGRMETRPANIEGKGEVRQRDLVRNALRMRPDRIIVGECRGEEAFDMLQAMNTGHEGSMTTIHANSPRDALKRLEQMVGMAGTPMTQNAIRSQIASAITLVIQVQRLPDGARRLTSVSEITGMEGEVIQMHEIFKFVKDFTDGKGTLHGSFKATGIRPRFLADLKAYAIEVPSSCFDPARNL